MKILILGINFYEFMALLKVIKATLLLRFVKNKEKLRFCQILQVNIIKKCMYF